MRNAVKFYKFLDTARRFCFKFIRGCFISLNRIARFKFQVVAERLHC